MWSLIRVVSHQRWSLIRDGLIRDALSSAWSLIRDALSSGMISHQGCSLIGDGLSSGMVSHWRWPLISDALSLGWSLIRMFSYQGKSLVRFSGVPLYTLVSIPSLPTPLSCCLNSTFSKKIVLSTEFSILLPSSYYLQRHIPGSLP